jgi:hypothetical protein
VQRPATRDFTLPGVKRPPGQGGDDAALSRTRDDGVCLLVVADGIGSGSTSGWGARLAVEVVDRLFDDFELTDAASMANLLDRAAVTWAERVNDAGASLRESATTLGVAVVAGHGIGLGAVGDCFALVRRGHPPVGHDAGDAPDPSIGVFAVLDQGRRDPSTFATATPTLASRPSSRRPRTLLVDDPGITGVLVSTDGMEEAFLTYALADGRLHVSEVDDTAPTAVFLLSEHHSSAEIAKGLLANDGIMALKGDDVGIAVAVW